MKKTTKLIIGIICIIVAIATVFGVTPLIAKVSANKQNVVQMTQDVVKGKQLTEDDLKVVEVSMNNLRPDIAKAKDMKELIGQYALVDLNTGDFIVKEKVSKKANKSDQAIAKLPAGKEAYSIIFKGLDASVSSKVEQGDIIRCYVTNTQGGYTFIDKYLQYLEVLTTTDSSGIDTGRGSESENISNTVTLILDSDQIQTLASYDKSSNYIVSFSIIKRGSDEDRNHYIKLQEQINKNLKNGSMKNNKYALNY